MQASQVLHKHEKMFTEKIKSTLRFNVQLILESSLPVSNIPYNTALNRVLENGPPLSLMIIGMQMNVKQEIESVVNIKYPVLPKAGIEKA